MNEIDQIDISSASLVENELKIGLFRNDQIEKSIIGSLLCDAKKWLDVENLITHSDFTNQRHQNIYKAIEALINLARQSNNNEGPGIAVDTIIAMLENQGSRFHNDETYLEDCRETPENPEHLPTYVNLLRTASLRRNIRNVSIELKDSAVQKVEDLSEILNNTLKILQPIQAFQIGRNEPSVMSELISQVNEDFQTKENVNLDEKSHEIITGLDELDSKIGEFLPGQLCIVGARPGVGKTAFALQVARKNLHNQHTVMMFSLEMNKLEIMHRLICSESGIFLNRLKYTRNYKELLQNKASYNKLSKTIDEMKDWNLILDDTPSLSETELAIKVHRMKQEHPNLKLVIVDYITLMKSARRLESRNLEVAAISREMKLIAKQEGVILLVLSQLNRTKDADAGASLSSLRDSGALEQDADLVLLLEKIKNYAPSDEHKSGINISLAKNRNGPVGEYKYISDMSHFTIENTLISDDELMSMNT